MSTGTASAAGDERGVLAPGVARVALDLRGEHLLDVEPQLLGAALRAHSRLGGQEDLDRRVGAHDRADVAPLGDPVAVAQQHLLLAHERVPHARGRS